MLESKNNSGPKKLNYSFPEGTQIPESLEIYLVSLDNKFMKKAAEIAAENRFENMTVTSTVLVKDGQILSFGTNGDGFHQKEGKCLREGYPAGEGYEKCPGCHPDNHSERVAIKKAREQGLDLSGAEAYLYGHWWSCETCMNALKQAGVKRLFLLDNAQNYFDRSQAGAPEKRKQLEDSILNQMQNE